MAGTFLNAGDSETNFRYSGPIWVQSSDNGNPFLKVSYDEIEFRLLVPKIGSGATIQKYLLSDMVKTVPFHNTSDLRSRDGPKHPLLLLRRGVSPFVSIGPVPWVSGASGAVRPKGSTSASQCPVNE